MDIIFLCVVIFLFMLAIFDLSVGVSNDAVNFLNSAIGSGAATFKRVIIVASIGVFLGAAMSNGMMDIARHGIFRPENFSFYDLICIFMAVMVTDVILLDIFNNLGMPTSTTVSMVFELLGATFVVALIKMAGGSELGFHELLNTGKALSVILGIFLSVAIAFVFGTVVQFLARLIFSFNYRSRLKWKIGLFGGICATAIVYFLMIKGAKELVFMTPEIKAWIAAHTGVIIAGCFVFFTLLMQLLHALGINVLKVIVLLGTFALAMAFAGNDLVNFIGVPLSGLASYTDFVASGSGDASTHMMDALNGPADTPAWFLIGAGAIMVVSLATSKKARNVTKTSIGLSSSRSGDEMFGSSRIARRLVRWSLSVISRMRDITPLPVRRALARRFNADEAILEHGAAFDLVRGSVNLVLAGALIAAGTSLKLPLSTTFVTFMVAMGTSLADRAWGRESAVFRITGVISVIGGWFVTAGVAFIGAGIIVAAMHYGGQWVMIALAILTVVFIIRSNRRFKEQQSDNNEDALFRGILDTDDKARAWDMLLLYITQQHSKFIAFAAESYDQVTAAFADDNARALSKAESSLSRHKDVLKNARRKETLCLRHVSREIAIEKSAWFHLANNCCMSILYNLRRIDEVCLEHVDNNFLPLPQRLRGDFDEIRSRTRILFNDTLDVLDTGAIDTVPMLRHRCDELKDNISATVHTLHDNLRDGDPGTMSVLYVYLNTLQETQELISSLRKFLRATAKLHTPQI
ncbi:MAG: inorganic phosphate transporter [Muribaculaceae bacterium]|nr:inorganic phosphate transporter [Muribaculaceae bacterium]